MKQFSIFENVQPFGETSILAYTPFSYPEPILRAVNGARQGALAKSISNWHLIGHNEGCCSNTGYILLPCFYGIRLWIWPEPLVAPCVRRALGTRMHIHMMQIWSWHLSIYNSLLVLFNAKLVGVVPLMVVMIKIIKDQSNCSNSVIHF